MKTSLVSTAVLAISSLTSAAALDKPHRMRSNQSNYQRQQQNQLQDTSYNEEKNDAYIGLLAQEEEDGDIKRRMQVDSSMSMSGTCSFCSGGLDDPDIVLPTDDGVTCATASAFAGSLLSSDPNCSTVQLAESICCPPSPTTEAPPPETTEAPPDTPAPPTDGQCSCSPLEYTFILNLSQDCDVDDLEGADGIGLTFCFLGSADRRRLGSGSRTLKTGIEVQQTIEFVDEDMSNELTPEMLVPLAETIEILSIQFLEFDTSGELIVINQDDSLSDVTLADGSEVTFESISNNLDSNTPIGDQLDFLPGGVQVTLRGRVTDDVTGDSRIVSNRITWSYTNACDVQPLEGGESIGWISAVSIIMLT